MLDERTLRARVEQACAGLDLPSWPDPHADREVVEEEYSRLTDPERYRVLHLRARAWVEVLAGVSGVVVDQPALPTQEHVARVTRLSPPGEDAVPLLILETDAALPGLIVALGTPDWELDAVPDCGCDACDSGSADLLEVLDDLVVRVVLGPVVLLRHRGPTPGDRPRWSAEWHPTGSSARGGSGAPDLDELVDLARRLAADEAVVLPEGGEALISRGWGHRP